MIPENKILSLHSIIISNLAGINTNLLHKEDGCVEKYNKTKIKPISLETYLPQA